MGPKKGNRFRVRAVASPRGGATHTHTHTSRRPSSSIQLDLHTTHTGPAPQQARRGPSTTPQQDAAPRPRQQARRSSSTTPPASQDVSSSDATRKKIDVTDFLGRGSLNAAAASTTRSQSGSSLLSHRYPFITHSLHSSSTGSILAKLLKTQAHTRYFAPTRAHEPKSPSAGNGAMSMTSDC